MFFNGFHQKAASIDRCIDNVCFLPSDDALYLLTDASITHKVDPDSLDSLDEVCIISSYTVTQLMIRVPENWVSGFGSATHYVQFSRSY